MHAVDASAEAKAPDLGYGVGTAATGVAQHINFASESDGASGNVKTHVVHVAAGAGNTVEWVKQIVALGRAKLDMGFMSKGEGLSS